MVRLSGQVQHGQGYIYADNQTIDMAFGQLPGDASGAATELKDCTLSWAEAVSRKSISAV